MGARSHGTTGLVTGWLLVLAVEAVVLSVPLVRAVRAPRGDDATSAQTPAAPLQPAAAPKSRTVAEALAEQAEQAERDETDGDPGDDDLTRVDDPPDEPPTSRWARAARAIGVGPVVVLMALGTVAMSVGVSMAREDGVSTAAQALYVGGLLIVFLPAAVGILLPRTPNLARVVLAVGLPLLLRLSRTVLYPTRFMFHDEPGARHGAAPHRLDRPALHDERAAADHGGLPGAVGRHERGHRPDRPVGAHQRRRRADGHPAGARARRRRHGRADHPLAARGRRGRARLRVQPAVPVLQLAVLVPDPRAAAGGADRLPLPGPAPRGAHLAGAAAARRRRDLPDPPRDQRAAGAGLGGVDARRAWCCAAAAPTSLRALVTMAAGTLACFVAILLNPGNTLGAYLGAIATGSASDLGKPGARRADEGGLPQLRGRLHGTVGAGGDHRLPGDHRAGAAARPVARPPLRRPPGHRRRRALPGRADLPGRPRRPPDPGDVRGRRPLGGLRVPRHRLRRRLVGVPTAAAGMAGRPRGRRGRRHLHRVGGARRRVVQPAACPARTRCRPTRAASTR
nr:hypothetical protein [Angustibacter aerolatus]